MIDFEGLLSRLGGRRVLCVGDLIIDELRILGRLN